MPTAVLAGVKRALALIALAACADAPEGQESPNEGLLRDFVENGKFDAAGHPLNAKSLDPRATCGGSELRAACTFDVPHGATNGELVINARLRVKQAPSRGSIVKIVLLDDGGEEVGTKSLTVSQLRHRTTWLDVSVQSSNSIAKIRVEPHPNAKIELDYLEIFPRHFGLVVAPGSGVYGDSDLITFEVPAGRRLEKLDLDGTDVLPRLDQLVSERKATRTTTSFRTLISAPVGELLPARGDVAELAVRTSGSAARVQLRKAAAPCSFEGDPAGKKVFITGFQPFPADGWHENISAVAVTAMNPANLRNAQVMRLVLPVEYDRAPDAIVEVIERCNPDVVISFGQGGGAIALEQTAYNLQDTGEISGGVPDNRGIIRAAVEIEEGAAPTRATRLPLAQIHDALEAIGELPQMSNDPGRYICNNTMFLNIGTGRRAGFIHLPYTTMFDDSVRARWAKVVETAVQAAVDAP